MSMVYVTDKHSLLAVNDIDFAIRPGEFVSLVGPSGCGKSTILSLIAGLLVPSAGQIKINGEPVRGTSSTVGYMLQQDYLFPWKTILGNCLFGLRLMNRLTEENRNYVDYLLEEMGLQHTKNMYPSQLSGGMRQRVSLVRTLAAQPEIMLLDEPFSALDYQTKLQLEDLVWKTLKNHKKTALLVTHDISEAIAMSDRVLIMARNPGSIRREIGIPEAIRRELPFTAREQPGFHEIFREVWGELKAMEEGGVSFG